MNTEYGMVTKILGMEKIIICTFLQSIYVCTTQCDDMSLFRLILNFEYNLETRVTLLYIQEVFFLLYLQMSASHGGFQFNYFPQLWVLGYTV